MVLIYNTALFEQDLMERITRYYLRAFERMLEETG